MKRVLLGLAIVLAATNLALASTTSQLTVKSGAFTCIFTDTNATAPCATVASLHGDDNMLDGSIAAVGEINGWIVSTDTGTSNSPNNLKPVYGLALHVYTATCKTGGCATDPLEITYSDVNFTNPSPSPAAGLQHTSGAGIQGPGTFSDWAYFSNTNTLDAPTKLISKNGPFTDPGGFQNTYGPVAAGDALAPYSLTINAIFNSGGTTGTSMNLEASITSIVPEPASVALFGTVLAVCASFLRRRKSV